MNGEHLAVPMEESQPYDDSRVSFGEGLDRIGKDSYKKLGWTGRQRLTFNASMIF
jgi:hypothetical protein